MVQDTIFALALNDANSAAENISASLSGSERLCQGTLPHSVARKLAVLVLRINPCIGKVIVFQSPCSANSMLLGIDHDHIGHWGS